MTEPVYRRLSSIVQARLTCAKSGNDEWFAKYDDRGERIARDLLPHGSGIDSGTSIDWDKSTPDRLVLRTAYHHMNAGGYDGWTEHTVIVTPSLVNRFDLRITGRNRGDIKEYLADTFDQALLADCDV